MHFSKIDISPLKALSAFWETATFNILTNLFIIIHNFELIKLKIIIFKGVSSCAGM